MGLDLPSAEQKVAERFLAQPGEDSFRELFRAFSPRLMCYFQARGCDAGVAEELTQDVLLTVHRRSSSLRDPSLFRPWLFKIARNAILSSARPALRSDPPPPA